MMFYLPGAANKMFLAADVKMLKHKHCIKLGVDYSGYLGDPEWTEKK